MLKYNKLVSTRYLVLSIASVGFDSNPTNAAVAEGQKSVILSHCRCQQSDLAHDRYLQRRVNML